MQPPATWRAALSTSQASYTEGTSVPMTLRVTNASAQGRYLEFPSSCQSFFVVTDAGGSVVYDERRHTGCWTVLTRRFVAADATVSNAMSWPQRDNRGQPVPPGVYTIDAFPDNWGPERPHAFRRITVVPGPEPPIP